MTIFLNGQFMPITEAKISVLDRGFIFGDGVYEVIPVYSRKPFRLDAHLQRLQHSLDGIKLPNPCSNAAWVEIIRELIARNDGDDQYLYLHITRGAAKRDHAFPNPPVAPTVFMMSSPLTTPSAELLHSGVSAVSAQDNRWLRCDIKAISLLPNVLLRQLAVDAECMETILFRDSTYGASEKVIEADAAQGARSTTTEAYQTDRRENEHRATQQCAAAGTFSKASFLTEGAASNIFVVKHGVLLAPPKDHLMLPGITYDVILEIAAVNGIAYEVRKIAAEEVFAADELLLTSSTKEVLAITQLDGKPVGNGQPGAMFRQLHRLYQTYKQQVMRA